MHTDDAWKDRSRTPNDVGGVRVLDELAHQVLSFITEHLGQLSEKYTGAAMSASDMGIALLPYLFSEPVPLADRLRTPDRCMIIVRRLVDEAVGRSKGPSRIYWDPFMEYLSSASRRHIQREALRAHDVFQFTGAMVSLAPQMRQYCLVPPLNAQCPETCGSIYIRDEPSKRVVEWVDVSWQPDAKLSHALSSSILGIPTAVAYLPGPHHKAAVSYAASTGASLGMYERSSGRLLQEVPMMTHQTVMKWMPKAEKLVCGSALGEVSVMSPSGRSGPTVVQPHNGPINYIEQMSIMDAYITGGSDGRLAIVDAGTVTEMRKVEAVEGHILCAALHAQHNVIVVGGSSPSPVLWCASLPPYASGLSLTDGRKPHLHNVVDLAIHKDVVLSLDAAGMVKVWDIRTFKCLDTVVPSLPEQTRKVTMFSKLLCPWTSDTNDDSFVAASSAGGLILRPVGASAQTYVPVADVAPINHLGTILSKSIVTVSSVALKFWSCKSGELQAEVKLLPNSTPTVLYVPQESEIVYLGMTDGTLYSVDYHSVLERADDVQSYLVAVATVSSSILGIVSCGSFLLVGAPDGCIIVRPGAATQPLLPIHGLDGFCASESSSTTSTVAVMTPQRHLFVVEASEDGDNVEDFREYDLTVSLRSDSSTTVSVLEGCTQQSAFCFLGSPTVVCVADGTDLSIISLVGSRTRRLLSFSTLGGGRCTSMGFEDAAGKAVLLTLCDDGTAAVFSLTDTLPEISKCIAKGFLGERFAPVVHSSFQHPGARFHVLVPALSACFYCFHDGRCVVFRVDGVRMGDLDMHGAPGTGWITLGNRGRRGSNIVFRVSVEANDREEDFRHANRHLVPMRASQKPNRKRHPLLDLPFEQRLTALTEGRRVVPPAAISVKGEKSNRTLQPLDPSVTKWTTDARETKVLRQGMKMLTDMRLFTQGLQPHQNMSDPSPTEHRVALSSPTFRAPPLSKLRPLRPLGPIRTTERVITPSLEANSHSPTIPTQNFFVL